MYVVLRVLELICRMECHWYGTIENSVIVMLVYLTLGAKRYFSCDKMLILFWSLNQFPSKIIQYFMVSLSWEKTMF